MPLPTPATLPPDPALFDYSEVPAEPRARWFLKRGEQLDQTRGFASKESASTWIKTLGRRLDWQAGFVFRLRGDTVDMSIVDRRGLVAKP